MMDLDSFPVALGVRDKYTLDGTPGHHAHTLTQLGAI